MRKILGMTAGVLAASLLLARLAPAADDKAAKKDDGKAAAVAAKDAKKDAKAEAPAAKEESKEKPAAGEAPEFITFDKTNKMAPVKFPHKLHSEKAGGCKACHEGEKPLFAQKKSEAGLKMADMYAGKACGSCHDGNKEKGHPFAAKTGCMKCHKK